MKVLVTGGMGWAALSILQALVKGGLTPIAFDLPGAKPPQNDPIYEKIQIIPGDIMKFSDVLRASREVAAIIHLAVVSDLEGLTAAAHLAFGVNVQGAWNVFEAARRNGVESVVLMSSAAVHTPPKKDEILGAETDWRGDPGKDHLYDLTKRLQETIARDFCETYGMRAVALRAGHIVDGETETDRRGRPLAEVEYCRGGWVCRRDLARAVLKALAYDQPGYSAFHVIGSAEAWGRFDLDRTEKLLGVKCRERFEKLARFAKDASAE